MKSAAAELFSDGLKNSLYTEKAPLKTFSRPLGQFYRLYYIEKTAECQEIL